MHSKPLRADHCPSWRKCIELIHRAMAENEILRKEAAEIKKILTSDYKHA